MRLIVGLVTGGKTTFEKCNRRKSEAKRKCSYNGSDFFAGRHNAKCKLHERRHSILSGLWLFLRTFASSIVYNEVHF